jgi:glycosyltransferase involved in cell wall biosynthesis
MKFSIVTPCFNSVATIRKTFEAVLNQTFTDYEYIVVDGGSKDGTLDIIQEYEAKFNGKMRWISEPDNGIYDAVAKGFRMSSGEILTWIGADDLLFPTALNSANDIFEKFHQVSWLVGESCMVSEQGVFFDSEPTMTWAYHHFITGHATFLQQEGCFFKRTLWEEAGACFASLRWAADYELWLRFAKITNCYVLPVLMGAFRMRSAGQASLENLGAYYQEIMWAINSHLREEKLYRQVWFLILRRIYNIGRVKRIVVLAERFFRKRKVCFSFDRLTQSWIWFRE